MSESQISLYFVVDVDKKLGLGHLMRSITLAHAFRRVGLNACFVTDYYKAKKIVYKLGFDVKNEIVGLNNRSIVVIDSYRHSSNQFQLYKDAGATTLVVDDLADRDIICDAYLNHNLFAKELNLKRVTTTRTFLGWDYSLVSPEYYDLESKRIHPDNQRIH